jgi:hypothetical protein
MASESPTADEAIDRAVEQFVAALANVLQARKTGPASIALRAELAAANANAAKVLNTKNYNDAVRQATRISDQA